MQIYYKAYSFMNLLSRDTIVNSFMFILQILNEYTD